MNIMAVATPSNVTNLMKKALDRRASLARAKFKLKQNQIQKILTDIRDGNPGSYGDILQMLGDSQLNDDNFRILLEDCISCIVLLGREAQPLVDVICNIPWASRSEDLIALYMKFLLNLVTAHIYNSPLVMTSLVKQFKADGENWKTVPPDDLVRKWSNVHNAIAQIIAIMPMSSEILMDTIVKEFPYYKAGCYCNRAYVHNLIWITKYLPSLQEPIITTVVNKLIMMDVNNVEHLKNPKHLGTVFPMETDEPECEIAETLDYCMLEMLHWLQEEWVTALATMCNVFEKVILPTYGIKHVQFLLLYTISVSETCADRILNNLWTLAAGLHGLGPGALATRKTAASHLSGILARCARLPNERLIKYLRSMCDWCHSYITATQQSSTANDNAKMHGAFHAICHAVFYLVAFKHQHLFMSKENINFMQSLNLARLVKCSLNPLCTCPPQVARAFSAVTRAHQIVYCQAILERNARYSLHTADRVNYDEWFPYDPYTLTRSGEIVWPLCTKYKDWPANGDNETQYSRRNKQIDDDDYLSVSPDVNLVNSISNCIFAGFKSM